MTLEEAKALLGDAVKPDGGLYDSVHYLAWTPGDDTACLDAYFTADELEAIAVVMRSHTPGEKQE